MSRFLTPHAASLPSTVPFTGPEATTIEQLHRIARPGEPAELWLSIGTGTGPLIGVQKGPL